jgi:hypothetical protein
MEAAAYVGLYPPPLDPGLCRPHTCTQLGIVQLPEGHVSIQKAAEKEAPFTISAVHAGKFRLLTSLYMNMGHVDAMNGEARTSSRVS